MAVHKTHPRGKKPVAKRPAAKRPAAKKRTAARRGSRSRISLARLWCIRGGARLRQAFAGSDDLGYPFNTEKAQVRSAERQRQVEKYARVLLPGVYSMLKQAGVSWVPADADKISRASLSTPIRQQVQQFVGVMYILDLAYAVLKELKREAMLAVNKGVLLQETATRVAGIVANITGRAIHLKANVEEIMKEVRATVLPQQPRGGARGMRGDDYKGYLFPVSYAPCHETGPGAFVCGQLGIAADLDLFAILTMLNAGKVNTRKFSLTTRMKVFAPLDLDDLGTPRLVPLVPLAEGIEEIAEADSGSMVNQALHNLSDLDGLGIGVDFPNGPNGKELAMSILNDNVGAGIGRQERTRLWEAISGVLNLCKKAAASSSLTNPTIFGNDTVPYIVPHGACGPGQVPVGIGANGQLVQGYETEEGTRFFNATSWDCVNRNAKPLWPNAPARQAAISLRQVEALPKGELAKFVQRIVNM